MKLMNSFCRKTVVLIVACWLAVHGVAIAAPQQQKKAEPTQGSYVLPYAIVILTTAVGLMLVYRPSRRRDRAKPEEYDSSKHAGTEEE